MHFAAALLLLLAAQDPAPPGPAVFRTQSSLATVRFHVALHSRYVTNLAPSDVILLEDGVPRPFSWFENAQTALAQPPVELTLLFDTSGSVVDQGLLDPLVFKESLLDQLGDVRIAVYGFGTNLQRFTPPTRDFAQLQSAFAALSGSHVKGAPKPKGELIQLRLPAKRHADPRGGTWLYEAIAAATELAAASPRESTRMVLVFSDGLPTTNCNATDGAAPAIEHGVAIYPVVLGHAALTQKIQEATAKLQPGQFTSNTLSNLEHQQLEVLEFSRLADLTGGRSFDPPEITLSVMRNVLAGLVAQIRTEYVVGFSPPLSATPATHKLEVRLRDKSLGKVLGGTRSVVH